KTLSNNLPGFLIQSITSPTVSSSHFLPLAAIPSDLLTTALPPLTIFLVASFLIAFALLKAFSAKFQSFFFSSVPPLNLGRLFNIECVCVPFITDEPLGRNAVVSLLGVSAILPLGYLIASCLKPPGPFPRPLSPTVANVSRAILPFLTTFLVVLVCSVPVWKLIGFSLSMYSFSPYQLKPYISLFNPVFTPLTISPKKLPILPVTDLITSPILFITPVTLFFIPVTRSTVPLLMSRHFLDMKPPTEFIVLRVPLDKEPQAPLTPDQSDLALLTVPVLILFHLELMKLPTDLNMLVVPFLRLFQAFLTPDHKAFALETTAFLMLDHTFNAKFLTALNIAVVPFFSALNVLRTPFQSPLARFITLF